jgi:hypothetical protein
MSTSLLERFANLCYFLKILNLLVFVLCSVFRLVWYFVCCGASMDKAPGLTSMVQLGVNVVKCASSLLMVGQNRPECLFSAVFSC